MPIMSDPQIQHKKLAWLLATNLIVLDRDVLKISPFELLDTRVDLTMFRGKVVFER